MAHVARRSNTAMVGRPRVPCGVQYRAPYHGVPIMAVRYGDYRPVRAARRCCVESRRAWNGYRWVRRPIEVCRTGARPGYRY